MIPFLIFRLYGPVAAWGETAVGEIRPSATHPTKSSIIGLLSAAKGIRRTEEELLGRMSSGYGVAILEMGTCTAIRDFHTAQMPMANAEWSVGRFASRRHELQVANPEKNLSTVISWRDYICDSVYHVAIWKRGSNNPFSLEELKESLEHPAFVLYLGRRSCPLALPVTPILTEAEDPVAALCTVSFPGEKNIERFCTSKRNYYPIYFEGEWKRLESVPSHTESRTDRLLSRKRWQYGGRMEKRIMISRNDKGELCI